jgi:hypothetical protein
MAILLIFVEVGFSFTVTRGCLLLTLGGLRRADPADMF